jgi:hypothetical protein
MQSSDPLDPLAPWFTFMQTATPWPRSFAFMQSLDSFATPQLCIYAKFG